MTNEQVNKLEEKLREAEKVLEEAGRMLCDEPGTGARMWNKITYDLLDGVAEILHATYLLRPES